MMNLVANFWSRAIVHILDVLVVSYIFYHALLLIKGTRTVQIIFGIVIVALTTILAEVLGFPTLSWLLGKFWIAGVVVIAILFQSEMRSALARLGAKTAGRLMVPQEMLVINELVGAVREASRRQMGMLLVIERDIGLRNYLDSGTRINAELTSELLLTIFQPPAVLHDGAVIIQRDRVAGAGCILPLSNDSSLSKLLGTRHRAAVGISEISDAWAICVSEETGTISLAFDGKLSSNMDADDLRQQLLTLFRSPSSSVEAHEEEH